MTNERAKFGAKSFKNLYHWLSVLILNFVLFIKTMRGLQPRKIETNVLNENHGFSKSSTSQAHTSRDIKIIKFTGNMK
jgi:hypothetical protein